MLYGTYVSAGWCHSMIMRDLQMLRCAVCTVGFIIGLMGSSLAEEQTPLQVVEALYVAQEQAFEEGSAPLLMHEGPSKEFFFNDKVKVLNGINMGYDPLYQGQDAEITEMVIKPNTDLPKMVGTAVVDVSFRNFGKLVEMKFVLHRELADGDKWQVFDIEFDGSTLSALVSLAHTHPGGFMD